MASQQEILNHIEQSEYFKEVARILVKNVVTNIDFQELLSDPTYADDLLDSAITRIDGQLSYAVKSDMNDWLAVLGLALLTQSQLDAIFAQVLVDIRAEAKASLDTEIAATTTQVDKMINSGASPDVVKSTLLSPTAQAALLAGVAAIVSGAATASIAKTQTDISMAAIEVASQDQPELMLEWSTVGDADVCDSCDPRDGTQDTLDGWYAQGFPGSDVLLCSMYTGVPMCRCILELLDNVDASVSKVDATDAISAGKSRARDEYA